MVPKGFETSIARGYGSYMPRQPRLDTPGALHHVIGQGIDGIELFGKG